MLKKGQMQISFGMIFTLILVAVFIAFAFFGIKKFVTFQKDVQVEQFFENLQKNVDTMYKSTQGTKKVEYNLPSNVEEVCFVESPRNVRVELKKGSKSKQITNLNMEEILGSQSKSCAKVEDQKVIFVLSMNYGESSVTIDFENE